MEFNIISQIDHWLAGRYGSRRGFVKTCWHQIRFLAGGYRDYRQIDWDSVGRLVFVCRGNICRSAYAEAIARSMSVDSVSCGIDTRHDYPASEDAIRVANSRGIDLSGHRTTSIQLLDIRENDLFIVMEPRQAEFITREFGNKYKCSLLGLWGRPLLPHIQDPYGASDAYFNHCFNCIEKSVHEITSKVKKAS